MFSLGVKSMPGIRDLSGEIHSKTVQISVKTKAGAEKNITSFLKGMCLKIRLVNLIMAAG